MKLPRVFLTGMSALVLLTFAFVLAGCGNADGGPAGGPTSYTVSFDVGEETPVPAQTVVSGGNAVRPDTDPEKEGWYFKGPGVGG
ncbi:MAG: InlB B-repeat-containing protein [Treponema sp.]|nr:InlB B-repeat-containing protein [Treponema sp.]